MIIAVDAAGGDHYPHHPVEGALLALEENDSIQIILLGPEEMVREELEKHDYDKQRVHIQNAPEIIEMSESPSQAVKGKKKSSIVMGLSMHAAGKCDAFISTGNTGALLAASTFILGKLEGIIRPTIATYYPTVKGFRLLVDAGANLELKPEMFAQFGTMGSVYSREVMGIDEPKVALLNVGEEREKGTECLRKAFDELSKLSNFIGNVEGRDILPGKADVYVCDGLVGNLLLKFGESIPDALKVLVQSAVKKSNIDPEQAKQLLYILNSAVSEFNYENVGGIPFLGVAGVSMVGHGGSNPTAIKNMVLNAATCSEANVNDKIVASLN